MESKKCRKVPIILYDGTLVKKGPGADKPKARDFQLIPIKINFINSSGNKYENNLQKSKITHRSDANNCDKLKLKVGMMSSQALGAEVQKVPNMSSSPQHSRDQHHEDQHNKCEYETETLTKIDKDIGELKDKTETYDQNLTMNPTTSSTVDWRVAHESLIHLFKVSE